jgi:putative lipoic acid-binding regulatory protein
MPDPSSEAAGGSDAPFDFPCRFPIKAMGRAEDGFEAVVLEIVRRHAPDLDADALTVRPSSGGRWLAVTVTIEAESRAQLDAIYRDLSDHARVVWAL